MFLGMTIFILSGCENQIVTMDEKEYIHNTITFRYNTFSIKTLDYDDLPYTWRTAVSVEVDLADENGVILHPKYEAYHPVLIAQKILQYCDSYHLTNEEIYLEKAKLFADKMIDLSISPENNNNVIFYQYPFDFSLHGDPNDTMYAPWYSGMAQGQALSAFVRLYNITKNIKYKDSARKTFNSYFSFKDESMPWISYIDKNKFLWVEEYPMNEEPTSALNGFIFAIYGLYDYYLLTQDLKCKEMLLGCITTIKEHISLFRNPGDLSYYCIKHKVKNENYHKVHVDQLEMLFLITEDNFFREMTEAFRNDLASYKKADTY